MNGAVWESTTTEMVPPHEYGGVEYPGGVVYYDLAAPIAHDLWRDGYPDIVAPMLKGYATGVETRVPLLLFKNEMGTFREATDELAGDVPVVPGFRRTVAFADEDGMSGVFGVQHDTGDGERADAVLLTSGNVPDVSSDLLPVLPGYEITSRPHAVNAHALAAGDITADGRTDFVVGDLDHPHGTYALVQAGTGWEVRSTSFLTDLTLHPPTEDPGSENVLLDLHLADLDRDGTDDLVVGWGHGSTRSHVYFNDGEGNFSPERTVALPESIYGVSNTLHLRTYDLDVDRDDDADLLLLHSRFDPYYAGYTFQLLTNDGNGTFTDETSERFVHLPSRDQSWNDGSLEWSDNFYLLDVNRDGKTDIIGSDGEGVRLWLSDSTNVFSEVPVMSPPEFEPGVIHVFTSLGNGSVGSLVHNRSCTDDDCTAARVWFAQAVLRVP